MFRRTALVERVMLIAAGLLLLFPLPAGDVVGVALTVAAVVLQRARRAPAPA
jgi:hypothetical protein